MEIKDLAGIGKPLEKLIEVISKGVGMVYKPYAENKQLDNDIATIKKVKEAIGPNEQNLQISYTKKDGVSISTPTKQDLNLQITPPLEERSQTKLEYQNYKKQINIESITQGTADMLALEESVDNNPVDEDWITRFFSYAEDISNGEMQKIWSKVLAGEIKKPTSFSLRTLEALRNITEEEAQSFNKFARLAFSIEDESYFIIKYYNNKDISEKYDIKHYEHVMLNDAGLIRTELTSMNIHALREFDENGNAVFTIGNKVIIQKLNDNPNKKHDISVYLFTRVGQELMKLLEPSCNLDYINFFAETLGYDKGIIKYGEYTTTVEGKIIYNEEELTELFPPSESFYNNHIL
jgi:uncharacterized repeat protein (TIGR03899 family)